MNNTRLIIITFILAFLWGFLIGKIFYDIPCGDDVDLRIDTLWVHDTLQSPGPVEVKYREKTVPADVDTAAILQKYYTERIMADTLRLKDMATVYIRDTVYMNNIIGRYVDYDLARLDISATAPRAKKWALSLGTSIGRQQAAVLAGIRYKRADIAAGYDFRQRAPMVTLKYDILQWQ